LDWKRIKAEYIAGGTSYRKLAEKYGVSPTTLTKVAGREGWVAARHQAEIKKTSEIINSVSSTEAKKAVDKLTRVSDLTDKLLDKLEQAIEELDIQLYKDVEKVKEIEYNNELRPDKPTKEIIHEKEKVLEVKTIVDRSGLKAIASSLRDIKEIQMLKTELDKQEQEARINKLRKEAEREDDTTNEIEIVFKAGEEAWNE
jgi:isopentenyl diphosphate isomerase/L-lactate dehydrogenase-like FMN-dependent dehydrogenase